MRKLLLLALLCLPSMASAQTFVQLCHAETVTSGSTPSASCTLTGVAAHHLVIVTTASYNVAEPTVITDSLVGVNINVGPTGGGGCAGVTGVPCNTGVAIVGHLFANYDTGISYYNTGVLTGNDVVTTTWAAGGPIGLNLTMTATEYAGETNGLDGTATNCSPPAPPSGLICTSAPSIITTGTNDLIFASVGNVCNATAGTGFTLRFSANPTICTPDIEDRLAASPGTYVGSVTAGSASNPIVNMVAFGIGALPVAGSCPGIPAATALSACLSGQALAGGNAGWQVPTIPRLTITKATLAGGTIGVAYSDTLTAVNGTPPYTWSIAFGTLPPGLSLNSTTGVISGTPTATGTSNFTALVFDTSTPTAQTATKDMSITITCSPLQQTSTSPLPPATFNTPYSFQFQSTGGLLPITWTGTNIPAGLVLSTAGLLNGTPTTSGTFTLNITATDSCAPAPQVVTLPFDLTINSQVTITTTSPLPGATETVPYSTQLSASGGVTPYTWTTVAGSLPPGLSLASSGAISGTPTTAGTFNFTARVDDSAGHFNTKPFALTVTCNPLTITSTSPLPDGTQGIAYRFAFQSNGGVAPVAWTSAGPLPPGLSLSSAGVLSGTPSAQGAFTFPITATDSCNPTAQAVTQSFTMTVGGSLVITSTDPLPNGTVGQPYNDQLQAQGGVPPYTWSVPSGPVPAGAIDLLDWEEMPLPDRNNFHLTGGLAPRYVRQDGGLIWQMKANSGHPWDGNPYDDTYVYLSFTDNNDSSQQAACIAAGFTSCFVDPFAYKQSLQPKPFTPRYFVPGSTVTILTPPVLQGGSQVNGFHRTTNCLADNQPILYLGNVKTVTSGPANPPAWLVGNDVTATSPTITTLYYYSGDITGVYKNIERFYFVKGLGWAGWEHAFWNGTGYDPPDLQSADNNKVAGGLTSNPDFGCGVAALQINGKLPDGYNRTTAPSLNLVDSTGVINGTPSTAGTSTMHFQVEDSVGTIAQKDLSMTIACPAFSITSTSPLPPATQGSAYSFQFQSSGGIAPITWTESGTLPTGMSLSSTGLLSGTPTNFGSFLFTVSATDSCAPQPQVRQKAFSLTVNANSGPLTITTTSPLPGGTQGTPYSAQLSATGGTLPYTWAITVGHLPPGLTLHATTGIIDGTPTATEVDTPTFRVTDAISTTNTKVLSITVTCPTLTMVSTSPLPDGLQNSPYSYQFQASGGIPPYTWTRTGGTLPTGITLAASGLLSGTPTNTGNFLPVVQAADVCSPTPQTVSNTFSLTIDVPIPPLLITTSSPLPPGTVGVPYSTTLTATGGVIPYFWSLISGALPAGLSLNSATGVISGTPTTAQTTAPNIQVTDNVGSTNTKLFSITISCPPLSITSTSPLPPGTQNSPYSFQFTSAGGIAPVSWTVIAGTLPAGLTLTSGGLLAGTPTGTGTFSFTVQAQDSCSTPQAVNKAFSLTINPAAAPLQITTISPLPPGTIGVPYSTTMSATGGTPPYTNWIVSSGALPSGLTLHTLTGVIDGTPTAVQTTTPTIQVQDSVPNTTSKLFSITISAASTADNRYCTSTETVVGLSADGPAQPLQKCVYTALNGTPSPGSTITVTAGSFSDLQTKITAVACGQTIVIPALNGAVQAVYTGKLTLPVKTCAAGQWITVRTDKIANLPAEGTRISPAWVGTTALPGRPTFNQPSVSGIYLPKLIFNQANQMTVLCSVGDSRWRFIGLEVTSTAGINVQNAMISCPNTDHMIFDRMLVHGGNSATWQDKDIESQGISLGGNSTYDAVIDSYIGDIHCLTNTCTDSYAVLAPGSGNSTQGPIKLVNNFEEAAGEGCALSGGGGSGATTQPFTDFEVRRNHCFKPLFWFPRDASFFGTTFNVKNSFELKATNRFLLEGNIFDSTWTGTSDQFGTLVNFGSKNQSSAYSGVASSNGTGTLTWISGAVFRSTIVSPNCAVPLHCRIRYNGIAYQAQTYVDNHHVTVTPAPPASNSSAFVAFDPGLNPNAIVANGTIRYNHFIHGSRCLAIFAVNSDGGDFALGDNNISVHDNVCDDIDTKWSTTTGACCFWASSFQVQNQYAAPNNLHDIWFVHNTALSFQTFGTYQNGHGGPSFGFGFQSSATGAVPNLKFYDNIGTVGWTGGASICNTGTDSVLNRMKCYDTLNGVAQNSYCFDHNLFSTTTQPPITGATNNPPYPAAGQSPGCGFTTTGQTFVTSFAGIGFTNLNAANGGNYLLLNTSPGHLAGHDGKDMGADINLLNQYTSGVQ